MSLIDLSQLPAPGVIESLDFEAILASMKAHLIALSPELEATINLESDPVVKLLEVCAYRELVLRNRINEAAKSVMLPYATGADLDNLGALVAVARFESESDADYRQRILLSYGQYSTAGAKEAYIYHAMSAHEAVKDVAVHSIDPGEVTVVVLSNIGNGEADNALLRAVSDAVNAETVRPLCDTVLVQSAEILYAPISATLVIANGPDQSVVYQAAYNALANYVQTLKLSEALRVSQVYALLHQAGVLSVSLGLSSDIEPERHQAIYCNSITLTIEVAGE